MREISGEQNGTLLHDAMGAPHGSGGRDRELGSWMGHQSAAATDGLWVCARQGPGSGSGRRARRSTPQSTR